jgi:hypothetical protein
VHSVSWVKLRSYLIEKQRLLSRKPRIRPRDPSRWPRGTLYPQKLAITSPTSGGRSVGIVRSRTQTMEFSFFIFNHLSYYEQFWRQDDADDSHLQPTTILTGSQFRNMALKLFSQACLARNTVHVLRVLCVLSAAHEENTTRVHRACYALVYTDLRIPLKLSIGSLHWKLAGNHHAASCCQILHNTNFTDCSNLVSPSYTHDPVNTFIN